jgi:hypothetical protein
MPDTIEDRAVVVRMRRRAPGETVAPFRHRRDRPALVDIAAQLAAWLGAHVAELERAEPVMPLEDRAADTWEPLIARLLCRNVALTHSRRFGAGRNAVTRTARNATALCSSLRPELRWMRITYGAASGRSLARPVSRPTSGRRGN